MTDDPRQRERKETMRHHDRKPVEKRQKDWGNDYYAAERRAKAGSAFGAPRTARQRGLPDRHS